MCIKYNSTLNRLYIVCCWILLILHITLCIVYLNIPKKSPKRLPVPAVYHDNVTHDKITHTLQKLVQASRYERNNEIKSHIDRVIRKLKIVHTNLFSHTHNALKQPLQHLTIVFDFVHDINMSRLPTILNGLDKSRYRDVPTLIVFDKKQNNMVKPFVKLLKTATFIPVTTSTPHITVLMQLLELVNTTYIFIARKLEYFNNFVSLEKMLNPLLFEKASVVGGAHRDSIGHWKSDCYKTNMIWYRFRLVKGYELNDNNFAYCDYVDGPFAATTKLLKTQLQNIIVDFHGDILYLDLMVHMNKGSKFVMLCMECMFFKSPDTLLKVRRDEWKPFVKEYSLNKVILSDSAVYEYSCSEAGIKCSHALGKLSPYCCYKELHDMALFSCETFNKHNLQYELDSGSVLGSVKLHDTLYWERDHDFNFRTTNISGLMKLQDDFKKAGYSLHEDKTNYDEKCLTSVSCGFVRINSANWFIELWGQNVLSTDIYVEPDKELYRLSIVSKLNSTTVRGNVTLTRLGNKWIPCKSNPGAYSRGHYGIAVLQHAQHWRDTKKASSWEAYLPGRWGKCETPGFHGCANIFLADGNLQFNNVWV